MKNFKIKIAHDLKRWKAQIKRGGVQGSLNFKGGNRNPGNFSEPGQNHRSDPPIGVDRDA